MHTIDLMNARVQELREEGRRAGSGTCLRHVPGRLATSIRKMTRRQR